MSKEAPGTMSKKSEAVNVVVRCRPMLQHETESGYKRVVAMDLSRGTVTLQSLKSINSPREFTYDAVYDWNSKQMDIYDETVRPIVDAVLKGYNGTVFAYGQTGTGKTYTMEGNRSVVEEKGVIPNSFEHIFTHISRAQENERYLVRASYLEIYQDEIRDLLSKDHKQKLELKERPDTGFYVKDLSSFVAKSIREVEHVMNIGNQNRSVGRTDMNEHSSRSHALFVLTVECSQCGADGENHIRVGKLNLVDLAGSEKQSKTGSTGDRFKEATKINLSLSALGNVISALVDSRNSHVPYRDSKLTKLLQDSLGGNAKTVMVANVGPADYNYDETLMTLRFANRAKNIQNKPRINEDPKDALLREYQEEIKKLKEALEKRRSKGGRRKRHRSGGATGEGADSGEDEDTNIASEDDPESNLKVQQAGLEAEKQAILQNGELLAEERQKLLDEVQHRADQLKKELKRRDALSSKIKAMESKLLAGGGSRSILDHTEMQKRELEKQRQEMIKQKRREREIQQQLQAKEESTLEIRDTYTSLQEEVDLKTKKLNKLRSKLAAAHAEIADYKEEQARMREELILTMEDLHRDLKLRTLLVNNFIPPQEVEKVVKHSMFVEDTEEWKLDSQEITFLSNETSGPRQTSTSSNLRPVSTFAKAEATRSGDPRYMAENILRVELDMPNRTTREYEGPVVSQLVQAALDVALQDEEEVVIDASSMVLQSHQRSRRPKISRNRLKAKQQEAEESAQEFPLSRGLVTPAIRFA